MAKSNQESDERGTGKIPLKYAVYEKLCRLSLSLPDGGFTHLFLILTWNLMCRSKSTETIRFGHLSSEDDAIGVTFYKTKKEQEGTCFVVYIFHVYIYMVHVGVRVKDPKHCYANPFKPVLCLFVSLGIYLACNTTLEPGCLFIGSNQKVSTSRHSSSNCLYIL